MALKKLAKFIVEKRLYIAIAFLAAVVYCIICIPKVSVTYDITKYLSSDTDTRKAITIMNEQFLELGSAKIMIENISYEDAANLAKKISALDGVASLSFSDSPEYYKDSHALFSIMFSGGASDPVSVAAYKDTLSMLKDYTYYVPSELYSDFADTLAREMVVILIIAAVVIVAVLLFTSKSFLEVLAFPIVFITAAILNMGTNFWLVEISFVSNTVATIMQLALAIDYSIILCHRFTEEKEKSPGDAKNAAVNALAKAIPEVAGSSLTTIAGMLALTFMTFRLGYDLGMVLAKSIICSIITVFFLMPGILLLLSKGMDKTRHRNFVPRISFWGKGVVKARYVIPVVFLALVVTAGALNSQINYTYSMSSVEGVRHSQYMVAAEKTQSVFGYDNMFVVLIEGEDYELQREVTALVEAKEMIDFSLGYASTEFMPGHYLTDSQNYRDFSALFGTGVISSRLLFWQYSVKQGESVTAFGDYYVQAGDILLFAAEKVVSGSLNVPEAQKEMLTEVYPLLKLANTQLKGGGYYRLVFNIDGALESEQTFALIEKLDSEVKAICPTAVFGGEAMTSYDLNKAFSRDNILITFLTILFILVILMFTFRSVSLPFILVTVIEGAILINFTIPVIFGKSLFFFISLIITAIQMGATIDYAIVVTNRFLDEVRSNGGDRKKAAAESLSGAFPTVITSALIMTTAAFLIAFMTSEQLIAGIGLYLGTGVIISVLSVMTVLPALLIILGKFIDKTTYSGSLLDLFKSKKKTPIKTTEADESVSEAGEGEDNL